MHAQVAAPAQARAACSGSDDVTAQRSARGSATAVQRIHSVASALLTVPSTMSICGAQMGPAASRTSTSRAAHTEARSALPSTPSYRRCSALCIQRTSCIVGGTRIMYRGVVASRTSSYRSSAVSPCGNSAAGSQSCCPSATESTSPTLSSARTRSMHTRSDRACSSRICRAQ